MVVDDYGKLRCCEYLPVGIVDFDETGPIKAIGVDSGFEDDYLLDYAQEINNEDTDNYTINFRYGIDRNAILNSINRMIEERDNHDS